MSSKQDGKPQPQEEMQSGNKIWQAWKSPEKQPWEGLSTDLIYTADSAQDKETGSTRSLGDLGDW